MSKIEGVESEFNLDTSLLYGFWIEKKGNHRILLPCDLMSHTRAQIDNNIPTSEIDNWGETRWFEDNDKPTVRVTPGEKYIDDGCSDGIPLDKWLQAIILTRWPDRKAFSKYLSKQAESVFPKLQDADLFVAGLVWPVKHTFLRQHIERLDGEFRKLANKQWRLEKAA